MIALPVLDNVPARIFSDLFDKCLDFLQEALVRTPTPDAAVKVISSLDQNGVTKLKVALPLWGDGIPVYKVAHTMGVPFRHVGRGIMLLGWGAKGQIIDGTLTTGDSHVGFRMCANKWQAARLLRDAGLPGVVNKPVYSQEALIAAASELGSPLVLKPNDKAQSIGVHVNLKSKDELLIAYDSVKQITEHILVERFVPGFCHRIMVAGDRVVYAVRRLPKSVTGNGLDTVTELIVEANKDLLTYPPWKRRKLYPNDEETIQTVEEQFLTMDSIPQEGRRVFLRNIPSGEWGGDIENLTAKIHPDNARLAIDATRLFGLQLAGVDLITTDISVPWHVNGAAINEINFSPQFRSRERERDAETLLHILMGDDGRIPIFVVVGEGDLAIEGRKIQLKLAKAGQKCHLTTATRTVDPAGAAIYMESRTLFQRSLALLLRKDVHAIILVGEPAHFYDPGLCFDRIECAYIFESNDDGAQQIKKKLNGMACVQSFRFCSPSAK